MIESKETDIGTAPPAVDRSGVAPHILVVDDDAAICQLISDYLAGYDMRVTCVADGVQMRRTLALQVVDLIVLDLRLPAEDGMSIARELRAESSIPIIMLTGRQEEVDRVMGLELGADDYLTKPFSPRELLARIRTVLRRAHAHPAAVQGAGQPRAYRFAGWELDLRTRRLVSPSGERVDLTHAEYYLLGALLRAPRRILSREQLLEMSRGYDDAVYDRSIDVQILRLRRKVEIDPSEPKLIRTERGAGYFIDAEVESV
ncbi:MAG TPA: response regulator [Burkholderiales bacterium]|nr:response regulator [Burkholderiales bacterium]